MYQIKKRIALELKDKFCKDNKINFPIEETCVFTFAGANQIKKEIGTMVDAFNLIANSKMILLLALKNQECQIGPYKYHGEYDVMDLNTNHDIIIISQPLGELALASLYKMSDFLVYPTQGESPGLQLSESQLAGCIPIVTNYAGSPEESCFDEFLLKEFFLHRGQFNCYRAIVNNEYLAAVMYQAYTFWLQLNNSEKEALDRYDKFMADVKEKFESRSWTNTALELSNVFKAILNPNNLRIDSELIQF